MVHPKTIEHMASRPMRFGHLLWHVSRSTWLSMREVDRQRYASLWPKHVPPRPSLDEHEKVIYGNGAGLDFLYAHRKMIAHANMIQHANGAPPLTGWTSPPSPSNKSIPVPDRIRLPEKEFVSKNDAVWGAFVKEAIRYTSPGYLRSVDLDTLGTQIEYGIHAAMHERFGGYTPIGRRLNQVNLFSTIDSKWDATVYDTLLDFYSAHVHPLFWSIHGWVDDRITDWERANGQLADFSGAWIGPMNHDHTDIVTQDDLRSLEDMIDNCSQASPQSRFSPKILPPDVRHHS